MEIIFKVMKNVVESTK